MSKGNDLAAITVGTKMELKLRSGQWAPVTIKETGNRFTYADERGRVRSADARTVRAPSRFRLVAQSVAAEPIAPMPEDLGVRVYDFRGAPCVIVSAVGRALGYADKALASLIRREWSDELEEGHDFAILNFAEAQELRGGDLPSLNPRGLTVLFESGFDLVLQKTDKPEGQRLRRRLADEVLPKLRRGEPVQPAPVATLPPSSDARLDRLERSLEATMGAVQKLTEAIPAMVGGIVRESLRALPAPASAPAPAAEPDAPVVVPMIPTDWITASDIAQRLTDRIKREVTKYRVDKIIREETRVRDDRALARQRPSIRFDERGQKHEHPQWFYAPAVAEVVNGLLLGDGATVGTYRRVDEGSVEDDSTDITDAGKRVR